MPPPTLSTRQLFSDQSTDRDRVLDVIQEAFAPGAPGILLVSDLYQSFEHDRIKLFQGARALAKLPAEQLAPLELPHLQYAVGWSRGREKFQGVRDESKGSFYANPIYDHPSQGNADFDDKYNALCSDIICTATIGPNNPNAIRSSPISRRLDAT
ncbi:hypothetical protein FGB62_8g114 [Gracilaria domingensis]|nr:hypothetical protein FGB62_8g114 [Gracilaria domingensis]